MLGKSSCVGVGDSGLAVYANKMKMSRLLPTPTPTTNYDEPSTFRPGSES